MSAPERAGREGDSQALPTPNDHLDIQSRVIVDILNRRSLGVRRYGTALQPHNGRNALQDAYEEAMDLCIYLKQKLVEEENLHWVGGAVKEAGGGVVLVVVDDDTLGYPAPGTKVVVEMDRVL